MKKRAQILKAYGWEPTDSQGNGPDESSTWKHTARPGEKIMNNFMGWFHTVPEIKEPNGYRTDASGNSEADLKAHLESLLTAK